MLPAIIYVTVSEKTAHFMHKITFQYKRISLPNLEKMLMSNYFFCPNRYLQILAYTHAKFERLEVLLRGRVRSSKAAT